MKQMRAEKFGTQKKRRMSSDDVNELVSTERIKARAHKFGVAPAAAVLTSEEMKKQRMSRFGQQQQAEPSNLKKKKSNPEMNAKKNMRAERFKKK